MAPHRTLLAGIVACWLAGPAAAAPPFCPPYVSSPIYRPRARQVPANPSNWISRIEGALDGDEILLADGVYFLDRYTVQITKSITVRGASGNRDAVLIQGQGYAVPSEGFMVMAIDVTIADLSMTGMRNHAISIKGEQGAEAPHIYNVHLFDIGTQHVKGTPGDGVSNGLVACSGIGYTPGGVQGDYINGIDIHRGINWLVRDNEIYNIWGDGSGCEVDIDCGTYRGGGGPAILFWNFSSGTVVERNRVLDSSMGIALGFGQAHPGGAARNNFVVQSMASRPGIGGDTLADMGIQIQNGNGTTVDHNTVVTGGDYPGAIEIWNSPNITVRNNLVKKPVWDRGGNPGLLLQGNKTNATVADLVTPGDPHLQAGSGAVDFASTVTVATVPGDIDGETRPIGVRRDAGCDEWSSCVATGTALVFHTLTPCRLVDTRRPLGPLGGPALNPGGPRTFDVDGTCGIPSTAKAISLNIAVVGPTGAGNISLAPGACPRPLTAAVNFSAGQTRSNNGVAALAAGGTLTAFATVAGAGTVHLVLDVNGYFE